MDQNSSRNPFIQFECQLPRRPTPHQHNVCVYEQGSDASLPSPRPTTPTLPQNSAIGGSLWPECEIPDNLEISYDVRVLFHRAVAMERSNWNKWAGAVLTEYEHKLADLHLNLRAIELQLEEKTAENNELWGRLRAKAGHVEEGIESKPMKREHAMQPKMENFGESEQGLSGIKEEGSGPMAL